MSQNLSQTEKSNLAETNFTFLFLENYSLCQLMKLKFQQKLTLPFATASSSGIFYPVCYTEEPCAV
jgi:hypothetical protein